MKDEIEEIYKKLLQDPDLFEQIVLGYIKVHPDASEEEIGSYIAELIAKEYYKEADEDKERRQRDIARDRILSKVFNHHSDSGDINLKKSQIKEANKEVSNSGTGYEREKLADLLTDYSTSTNLMIKKRRAASDEIIREINDA